MLAKHPKTGAPIRIMKSDASIWKNSKTLVWMKEPLSGRWKRWDTIIVGIELVMYNPDIVILTEDSPPIRTWLKTNEARTTRFILISSALVKALEEESFDVSQLGNVLCLEEFSSMYPFLGETWDGTIEDAIVSAAIIFRYNKVIGIKEGHPRLNRLIMTNVRTQFLEISNEPEPLVLIQQYYKPPQASRAKELYKCLKNNIDCEYVDKIILFVESTNLNIPSDPENKVIKVPMKARITFADCIESIQSQLKTPHIVVFANADIYLDRTWKSIWSIDLHDIFMALLRWEEGSNGKDHQIFGPKPDSQDTWVIHSDSVHSRKWNLDSIRIPFGKPGCDNAITVEFLRQKFKIVNPAMTLRTIHVHASEIRNYDPKDIIDKPTYMYVEPSGIHELNPLQTWDGWASDPIKYESLDRPLKATNPKMLGIFCSQINRDPSFVWSANATNSYLPPVGQDRKIEMTGGAFVSPCGLVYRYTDVCVGNTDIQKAAWTENKLSHLTPAHSVDAMMAFPLEAAWLDQPALFVLYYLSKVIKQANETPGASFWCKRTDGLLAAIKLFGWNSKRGRLLEYDEQTQVFSQSVYGRTAHGVRIMKSDIENLRSNTLNWVSTISSDPPIMVIVTDDHHINGALLKEMELKARETHMVRILPNAANATIWAQALSGVSTLVISTSAKHITIPSWAWIWLAPKGCKIIELQEEREPSDSLLHLAAAAEQEWILLQYPRSTPEGFKKIIMKEFTKLLEPEKEVAISLPCIYTPPKSMKFGFFGHKGDSFREMIDLWAEKGYVERKEDSSLTHCWLGEVGKVLLYDRPTWAWLEKAPEKEKQYTLCLTGNPDPSEKPNAKPWVFWPRQPRLVEQLSNEIIHDYTSRKDSVVFFGRIENEIQGQYRQDISGWIDICSKSSLQKGSADPYLLSPEEYLKAISNSKYGLCIRGFGPKCNREIELLAMGTVPVVIDKVDTNNYIEPLIDGIHILRVSSPSDAISKIKAISSDQWLTMSKAGHMWWKRNASIDGSWSRTKEYLR